MSKNKEATFRAWDDYDKKYLDFGEFGIYDIIYGEPKLMDEIYGKKGEMNEGMPNERLIFEQYTGFKDNNEKKIFEGDILLGRFDEEKIVDDIVWLSLTDEEKEKGEKLYYISDLTYLYNVPCPNDLEVIGNIRENPKFLKE